MPKGVLFDTVGKCWPDGIWHMMENRRVAAFGEARHAVEILDPGDIVFFWHAGHGLVAAARVAGDVCASPDGWEMYRDVKFVTPIPMRGQALRAMPFGMLRQITGRKFFMAAAIKKPYLNMDEAEHLAQRLTKYLGEEMTTNSGLIQSDPAVLMGKPVVAGTRITVELILEKLAAGETVEQVLEAHPRLTAEGVYAALRFAATVLRADVVYPTAGQER